jgi:hypothetical protein
MADFSNIIAKVENLKTVKESVIAYVNGVAAQVKAAVEANDAGDNSQLATLADDIQAQADAIAAAVTANTPAEPEPPPPGQTGGGPV